METLPIKIDEKDLIVCRDPELVLEEARKAAKALTDVINQKKKKVTIGGETYLEFEDWMLIARFYGISVKVTSTTQISIDDVRGYESRAEALLVRSGEVISAAEAMCLNDEKNWSARPLFMLRSMAQTRACAKALRNVLGWVPVLAGFKATPIEEMTGIDEPKENHEPPPPPWWDEPSSDKQIGALRGIMKSRGWTEEQLNDKAFKIVSHPIEDLKSLTRGEASKLIEAFQGGK